jgi:hypothetical protein
MQVIQGFSKPISDLEFKYIIFLVGGKGVARIVAKKSAGGEARFEKRRQENTKRGWRARSVNHIAPPDYSL